MAARGSLSGIASQRLSANEYDRNFADLHPPLDSHEALVEADRCYFCHDAPCMNACPTRIDIPMFIRQIATGNPLGSAKTIFDQNIMGGICARVCPTETLCEEVCVREVAEGKPVRIGLLQRYSTDRAMAADFQPYEREPETGKRIAVVGAGPAGLSCAHRLAMHGHSVTVYEARPKPGGLNEYGIAAYKTVDDFARQEIAYVTAIGGITVEYGRALGADMPLSGLVEEFDAVYLAIGLAGVNELETLPDDIEGCEDAVDWIAQLRQAEDWSHVPVGRRVVVIGGGMTAIDAAVQAKLLGADEVTLCYRGPRERMKASRYEQEVAQTRGVLVRCNMQPAELVVENGKVAGMTFERKGERVTIDCDQIFRAIGQKLGTGALNGSGQRIDLEVGRIRIDEEGRTSAPGVWAGGDCVNAGDDLTVTAVAQGRDAAESIHRSLTG